MRSLNVPQRYKHENYHLRRQTPKLSPYRVCTPIWTTFSGGKIQLEGQKMIETLIPG